MILLYNLLMITGLTVGLPLLLPYVLTSEKRRKTVPERLGLRGLPPRRPKAPRPERIWIHALSLGEVNSAVPLVQTLRQRHPKKELFFSASTHTGYQTAVSRLGNTADAVFHFPYDFIPSVRKVAGCVDPDVLIIVETDLWPNILGEMKRRGVPVFLVNTRLSQKSYAGYRKISCLMTPLLRKFTAVCPQSDADARRFRHLGVPPERIFQTGNIKFDQPPVSANPFLIAQWKKKLGIAPGRPVWVAGSTHEGEEEVLADVFGRLKREADGLCLIIAPRDPKRSRSVQQIFESRGIMAAEMAEAENRGKKGADVIIVDRIGVLKSLYTLGIITFVGGSLAPKGGHNPLEPASAGRPVMFGPHMNDFADIARILTEAGGAFPVTDGDHLYETASGLLSDVSAAQKAGKAGAAALDHHRGAAERILEVMEGFQSV